MRKLTPKEVAAYVAKNPRALRALEDTAYHEAGHAVVIATLGGEVDHVTVEPDDGGFKGRTRNRGLLPEGTLDSIIEFGMVQVAGVVAEHIHRRRRGSAMEWAFKALQDDREPNRRKASFAGDLEQICQYGAGQLTHLMYVPVLNVENGDDLWFQLLERRATRVLKSRWPAVGAVAQALLAKGTLSGRQVSALMKKALKERDTVRKSPR